MGRRGTKPTPTALKLARGNPGKRALNHEEPELPATDLTPPDDLTGRALQEWHAMGPMYRDAGVLTSGDMKCFETYCRIVGDEERYRKLEESVKPEEALRLGYSAQVLKVRDQLKRYLELIGGTPSSRSGIKARKPVDPADARRRRFFGIKGGAPGGTA